MQVVGRLISPLLEGGIQYLKNSSVAFQADIALTVCEMSRYSVHLLGSRNSITILRSDGHFLGEDEAEEIVQAMG